ncbi:transcription termination factor 2 [Chanos chanos]|uniref:Transcription termination factor 2 n=1 Tax=Chanos chanos TaxID=29144 RepID=A0A6J2WGN3_CHACN|nr:transcription termination factor 2 [Chanos chanos]
MERVRCNTHGDACLLKTGVKEGPNKGKSFYVCPVRAENPCSFTLPAEVPPSHCLHHEDSIVELQALIHSEKQHCYRLFYRCVLGKSEGKKWCGNVPWTAKNTEKKSRSPERPQASAVPPERNPFKVHSKSDKTSEWRKLQDEGTGGGLEEGKSKRVERESPVETKEAGRQSNKGEKEDGRDKLEKDRPSSSESESWRNKQLPAGMKIKKKEFVDERKNNGGEKAHKEGVESKERTKNSDISVYSGTKEDANTEKLSQSRGARGHSEQVYSESEGKANPGTSPLKQRPPKDTEKPNGKMCSTEEEVMKSISANKEEKKNTNSRSNFKGDKDKTHSQQSEKSMTPGSTSPGEEEVAEDKSRSVDKAEERNDPSRFGEWSDDDDDEVQLISVQPGPQKTSVAPLQKTLTSYPGFQTAPKDKGQHSDPRTLHSQLTAQLKQKKATLSVVNVSALPDKGERLKSQVKELEDALQSLSLTVADQPESQDEDRDAKQTSGPSQPNPFSRPGGTILLPAPPDPVQHHASASSLGLHLSQGYTQMYGANAQTHAFYGGRMTEGRLLAVRNATAETIDHLHSSLESCPAADTEAEDPKGIKVQLLPHQRRALAWLLWRETQKPCGGILADDMGLGKTLTMISLILAQKRKMKDEKDSTLNDWISKTDSSLVVSQGTLIVCPASLVHHWKKEIEKHVKSSRLSVYLYHGPNRQRNASVLAEHDVVVTTYSLVSKEIPVQKEDAERPSEDSEHVASNLPPLLRVAWARVILDEAHNIKNPKVQTSMAVCKLRARARWAVTGTPIQNNLLDMYSLLKFLRCSPFDEYKLWKAQVDNGSKRGGERLNILTRTLVLRRTKDQLDSSGKPLVSLPERNCELHRLKLSEDEQSVYDVLFAQSRSTLQSYLKRHEEGDTKKGDGANPFEKVAREFGVSQHDSVSSSQSSQSSSAINILSLLLRLRQCCCHLSLLKKTLDQSELQADGISLSLEEQLCALSLSEAPDSGSKSTVSLNGSRFHSELFEETHQSTKISAILTELKEIRKKNQKSVIVSQWTSMLRIVAVHLKKMDLSFAVIDGTVNPKKRMDLVEEFNTNPKRPQVMLVSLCAGGVGINLIGGNHLFLIDMHWNPALEDQACDRIYRVGQCRDVTIHRFVCEGTVEDKISSLQEKKKELAQKVLSGTGASFTKLSLADLRIIFGV